MPEFKPRRIGSEKKINTNVADKILKHDLGVLKKHPIIISPQYASSVKPRRNYERREVIVNGNGYYVTDYLVTRHPLGHDKASLRPVGGRYFSREELRIVANQ
ncbi:MAG TPA: hypothetical protein VJZ93_04295 [Candidatus Nanoarchaeia archaeon]|nr:hypothetical protein [Candidatus Nanoarchaeia archaeon]